MSLQIYMVTKLGGPTALYDPVFSEISRAIFTGLPRSDQRSRGMDYLGGLLQTSGRKSIRSISRSAEGQASDQRLHHFIYGSTWDWVPMRKALAAYLLERLQVEAWVVQPMVILKAGRHSVGVERRFVQSAGRALNTQRAVGVWAAANEVGTPVNWGLDLSEAWLDDKMRRRRAAIPDEVRSGGLGDRAMELYRDIRAWPLPARPVVLDAREMDASVVRKLSDSGASVIARIDGSVPLRSADEALIGHSTTKSMAAAQIIAATKGIRRRIPMHLHRERRDRWVASVCVTMPVDSLGIEGGGEDREFILMGSGRYGEHDSGTLYLTNIRSTPFIDLLRLCSLLNRVETDNLRTAENVGIRDYTGRSFSGWHRHVTLASAAHAIDALRRLDGYVADESGDEQAAN
ncbi:IS701 family transposase [Nocardia sp. NPDC051052]|uniref:IS701 family transposase n=1 Tax=Nocardia sp. NPDC051052 TaxID=3364322 RepID=UPI0037B47B43